ncbi:MAG: aminotransferase class I/II-fold pyridoxal phosphate-dependent enzyme, partial [Kamptonema sp. SIO4C4]|nr:aminotransferase class I/II-fold pyridoxal phosphate-dependent enzyme [Kamptonema sp. SIO4C4]
MTDYQLPIPHPQLPIINTLKKTGEKPHAPFYAPGHKLGQGIAPQLQDWWGKAAFQADLPELPEFDNLFAPEGAILEAQTLAARTFGADSTYFLINGSTGGILAAILATCHPGDKLILPRNIHQAAISGLILSGAIPVFLQPDYDPITDLAYSITPEAVSRALEAHPDAKGVLLLYPTYQGVGGDIEAIAKLTHDYHIPLLVDEAHGAHFAFHPDLPPSALSAGADLTVQSTHKTLGSLSQASMLHTQGRRINPQRLQTALQLVQSTSPNALLLASLDATREQMARDGQTLLSQTLQLAQQAHEKLATVPGISCLSAPSAPREGWKHFDLTRLTLLLSQLPLNGFQVDEFLSEQGVIAELPLDRQLTFILSLGNTPDDIQQLVTGVSRLVEQYPPHERTTSVEITEITLPPTPTLALSPRDAYFAPQHPLPLRQAQGRI